jgi:hypothetical protein
MAVTSFEETSGENHVLSKSFLQPRCSGTTYLVSATDLAVINAESLKRRPPDLDVAIMKIWRTVTGGGLAEASSAFPFSPLAVLL